MTRGARVLDIGCGDGTLMAALRDQKAVDARGIEISREGVSAAVARGLSVVQGDADTDLVDYPTGAFDFSILSQTLQTTRAPDRVLEELLRIGTRAIVSFPNFAYWRMRFSLLFWGRVPVLPSLPDAWYSAHNIHHVTIDDFCTLLEERGIAVERAWYLTGHKLRRATAANFRAEQAIFLLRR